MTTRLNIAEYKALKKKKPSKYRNEKTVVDGRTFDSRREASRYKDLRLMEKAEEITSLRLQERFPIIVCREEICIYVADFYYQRKDGVWIIEDSKGVRTPIYKLKKKLVEAIYGIKILET